MFDSLEMAGLWFLPDTPAHRIPGTLKYTPQSGVQLTLFGSLFGFLEADAGLPQVVHGSVEGKPITMFSPLYSSGPAQTGELRESVYVFQFLLGGHHRPDRDELNFECICVCYSNLGSWVYPLQNEELLDMESIPVAMKQNKKVLARAVISSDLTVSLMITAGRPRVTPPGPHDSGPRIILETSTYIEITGDRPQSFKALLDAAHQVRRFLSFALRTPVYPLTFEGTICVVDAEGKSEQWAGRLYHHEPTLNSVNTHLSQKTEFFRFVDVQARFTDLISRCFQRTQELSDAYDLYLDTVLGEQVSPRHKFLNLVQALEFYHRETRFDSDSSSEDHSRQVEEVVLSTPIEYRDWLQDKLRFTHEPNLRQRLMDLLSPHAASIKPYLTKSKAKSLIQYVVSFRNYLAHRDKTSPARNTDTIQLLKLTGFLRLLVEHCLLSELGFSAEEISTIMNRLYADEFTVVWEIR